MAGKRNGTLPKQSASKAGRSSAVVYLELDDEAQSGAAEEVEV